jgi:hypothetical protein
MPTTTGLQISRKFIQNDLKVAAVSRSITERLEKTANLAIKPDFSNPLAIQSIFDDCENKLGVPSVVV